MNQLTIRIKGREFEVKETKRLGPGDHGPMVYTVEASDETWAIIRGKLLDIAERELQNE